MLLELKKDIKFAIGENQGYLLFPKNEYSAVIMLSDVNNLDKSFIVKIGIIGTQSKVYTGRDIVNKLKVTTGGFNGEMTNKVEYEAYTIELEALQSEVESLSIEVGAKRKQLRTESEKQDPDRDKIKTLGQELRELRKQLNNKGLDLESKIEDKVIPDFEKVDKYDEVKGLFNNFEVSPAAFRFIKRQIPELQELLKLPEEQNGGGVGGGGRSAKKPKKK